MNLKIRRGTDADSSAVLSIVFQTLREYGLVPDPDNADADLRNIESFYLHTGGDFFVLEREDGTVVGCAGLGPIDAERCELRKMYLLPAARGVGNGNRLLEHCLARARQLGFKKVELETASALKEAIGLYKKYGFKPLCRSLHVSRCDQAMELVL